MRAITEQLIASLAPNADAASNGRKISQKGGFVRLEQSQDDTFFLGECKGSGKSNYITTIDFIEETTPTFRCSCPSRQFPCKHSLALLYEMLAGKKFGTCDIPQDILDKRSKKQARAEKAEAVAEETGEKPAPKVNKSARTKKMQKQLEGLDLVAKLTTDLLNTGLGAMGGTALATYRQLSKQLGDFYLPGPQRLLNRLIIEIDAFQKDGLDIHYENAVQVLVHLRALTKKAAQHLSSKVESGNVEQEDNLLYEELGGAWKLTELCDLGLSKENASLLQLSFWVTMDEARGELIDTGCWVDLQSGEIGITQNLRPFKALKYVKEDDTVFSVAQVPLLCSYPGEGNRRIRWDGCGFRDVTHEDIGSALSFGTPLSTAIKEAKNILKNPLADNIYYRLIKFNSIGACQGGFALQDDEGETIMLADHRDMEATVLRLNMLPVGEYLKDQVLLGGFFYDAVSGRMSLQPLSIITAENVIRLLY